MKAEIKSDLAEHYGLVELEYDTTHNQWLKSTSTTNMNCSMTEPTSKRLRR
jgi:hypothetical protein